MYKMTLQNGKEFSVETLIDMGGFIEIEFSQGTTYADVAKAYDSYIGGEEYSEEALRRFELHTEEGELIGTHIGYTEVKNISAFNGVVKVQVRKEDELKTEVEELKKSNEVIETLKIELELAKEELVMTNLYMTDLELELFEIKMQL